MSNVHSQMTGAELHDNKPLNMVHIDDTDSPYTMDGTEDVLVCDTSSNVITVNLMTAASAPRKVIKIINVNAANPVTVSADAVLPDLIGAGSHAAASAVLSAEDDFLQLEPDGVSRWLGFRLISITWN